MAYGSLGVLQYLVIYGLVVAVVLEDRYQDSDYWITPPRSLVKSSNLSLLRNKAFHW